MEIAVDVTLKTIQALIAALFYASFIQTKKKVLFVLLFIGAAAVSNSLFYLLDLPVVIHGAVNTAVTVGLIVLFRRVPAAVTLLYVLLSMALLFLFEIFVDLAFKAYFPEFQAMDDLPHMLIWGLNIIFMGFSALAMAIPYWGCNRLLLKKQDRIMRYFIPFLVLQLCLMTATTAMALTFTQDYRLMLILAAAIMVVSFLTDALLLRTFDRIQKSAAAEAELQQTQMSLSAQVQYYNQLRDHMGTIRKLRHDMKNQLAALGTLLEEGELEQMEKQLMQVEKAVDATRMQRFTGNLIADAILDGKTKECREKDISLEVSGVLPMDLKIEGAVLCSVLSNLLDNAIQACEKLPEEAEKQICLKCRYDHPILVIDCANTAGNREFDRRKAPALEQEHGWGLEILRELAERYSGGMDIRQKESRVDVMIWLSADNRKEAAHA